MKRFLLTITAILAGFSLALAQNDNPILQKIEKANSTIQNMQCTFTRTRTMPATGKVTRDEGDMYFTAPDKLAMDYVSPKEDMKINGKMLYVKKLGKTNTFDTDKVALMRRLKNMLLDCVQGKASKVAEENNADITVKEAAGFYNITMSAREVAAAGYSRIFLTYRKQDCLLVRLETIEFAGISEVYLLDGFKNVPLIDESRYAIPKK